MAVLTGYGDQVVVDVDVLDVGVVCLNDGVGNQLPVASSEDSQAAPVGGHQTFSIGGELDKRQPLLRHLRFPHSVRVASVGRPACHK